MVMKVKLFQVSGIKMTPLRLIFNYFMLAGFLLWPNVVQPTHFYGGTSLRNYLGILCSELHSHSRVQIALVVEGNRSQTNSPLARHLRRLSCGHLYRLDKNNPIHDPWRDVRWLYTNWLLLFDWNHLTRRAFTNSLIAASHLYTRCELCLPPIGLFDPSRWSIAQLAHWSHQTLPRLGSHFRMVLVAGLDQIDAAVHIRPVLDGCHLLDSVFLPKTINDYRRLRVPLHRCNLNGATLTVAANNYPPFCDLANIGGGDTLVEEEPSIEVEVLHAAEKRYNFRSKLVHAKQIWGAVVDGQWNGLISLVINQTVDFGICSIIPTYDRAKVVDFTSIISVQELAFISRGPIEKSQKWIIFDPFLFQLWLALLVSIVVIWAIIRWLSRASTTFIATKLYQIVLCRATDMTWKQAFSIRLLYGCWMFAAIVLATAYSCSFYSNLAQPRFEPLADTVEDLVRVAEIDPNRIYHIRNLFRGVNRNSGPLYTLSLHLNRTPPAFKNYIEAIGIVEKDPRKLLISPRILLAFFRQAHTAKPMHISSETIAVQITGWAFPKRSPIFRSIDWIIAQMNQVGLTPFFKQKVMRQVKSKHPANRFQLSSSISIKPEPKLASFHLGDFYSIFLVYFIGIALSMLVFIYEVVFFLAWGRFSVNRIATCP